MISVIIEFYKDYFDRYVLLSPNAHSEQWENAVEKLGPERVDVYSEWNKKTEAEFDAILKEQKATIESEGKLSSERILFIFDDDVDDHKFMTSSILTMLYIRGRHCNTSCVFGTQYYNGFPLKLRKNLSAITMFGTRNKKEIEALASEYCHKDLTEKQFVSLFEYATRNDYQFLFILPNHLDSREMYRKGFCQVLRLRRLLPDGSYDMTDKKEEKIETKEPTIVQNSKKRKRILSKSEEE